MFYPAPVVVDADVLIRNVDYAVRTGRAGALLSGASYNYSLFTGVVLFAASEIGHEAVRHLPDVAQRRDVSLQEVHQVWERLVVPNVRFVDVPLDDIDDPRVDEVRVLHAADMPTAGLAALLAECVLATDNRKHFRPFGLPRFGEVSTDSVSVDLLALADFGTGVKGAMMLPTAAGAATIEGSKKVISAVGRDYAALIALLALGGLALLATSDRGRRLRTQIAEVARQAGPPLAEFMANATAAGERVGAFAVARVAEPDALATVARRLAVGQSVMTTVEVARALRAQSFAFDDVRRHEVVTRAWLRQTPCFTELRRGHWTLGHYVAPLVAASSGS